MQGDLISRSALIEKLTYCRALRRESYGEVVKIVNEQPVAYDVEKVVAELGDKSFDIMFKDAHGEFFNASVVDLEKAIEIVLNGGRE